MGDLPYNGDSEFYALAETISDIVYKLDREGRFTYLNSAVRNLGYTREELIGKHFSEIIMPPDVESVSRRSVLSGRGRKNLSNTPKLFDERRSAGRKTQGLEIRLAPKGGEKQYAGVIESITSDNLIVEVNSSGLYQSGGETTTPVFIGTIGVIKDITSKKYMEKELENYSKNLEELVARRSEQLKEANKALTVSENNFRNSLDDSPLGILIVTIDGRIKYANRRMLNLWQYQDINELRNVPSCQRYSGKSHAAHMERMKQRNHGEHIPSVYEIDIVCKGGGIRNLRAFRKEVMWNGEKHHQVIHEDITERKLAEQRLAESEAKFHSIFAEAIDGIVLFDAETGLISECNPEFERITGRSIADLSQKKIWEIRPPAIAGTVRILFRRPEEQEVLNAIESSFLTPDGQIVPVEIKRSQVKISNNNYILGMVRDVTERKKAEQALIESEERFRKVFEDGPLGMVLSNADFHFFRTNNALCRMLGYTESELLQLTFQDIIHAEHAKIAMENIQRLFMDKMSSYHTQMLCLRKDSSYLWVGITVTAIRDQQRNFQCFLAMVENIHESKLAELALQESERRFRELAELLPEVVFEIDLDGNLSFANNHAFNLFGYHDLKKEKVNAVDYIAPADRERAMANIKKAITRQDYTPEEYFAIKKDGSQFPVTISSSLMKDNQGNVVGLRGLMIDITERRKMQENLLMTDRLASVGELASGIAHEINNPLTSIMGFSEILLTTNIPVDIKEKLEIINGESQRMARIVQNLLTFARKHETGKKRINVNEVLEKTLELRAYEHGVNNIAVVKRLLMPLPEIIGDFYQLQQVFLNIIINAEYFMKGANSGGHLAISTGQGENMVCVTISDDGPGIKPENLCHIFDPFFTTKPVGKGTGLGLSICHGIIAEHGGSVHVESEFGKGTEFVIEMPVAPGYIEKS